MEFPLEQIVPEQDSESRPSYRKVLADRIPLHRPGIDPAVRFTAGETPTWGLLYSTARAELDIMKE
jgi:hypothetical protein